MPKVTQQSRATSWEETWSSDLKTTLLPFISPLIPTQRVAENAEIISKLIRERAAERRRKGERERNLQL